MILFVICMFLSMLLLLTSISGFVLMFIFNVFGMDITFCNLITMFFTGAAILTGTIFVVFRSEVKKGGFDL